MTRPVPAVNRTTEGMFGFWHYVAMTCDSRLGEPIWSLTMYRLHRYWDGKPHLMNDHQHLIPFPLRHAITDQIISWWMKKEILHNEFTLLGHKNFLYSKLAPHESEIDFGLLLAWCILKKQFIYSIACNFSCKFMISASRYCHSWPNFLSRICFYFHLWYLNWLPAQSQEFRDHIMLVSKAWHSDIS